MPVRRLDVDELIAANILPQRPAAARDTVRESGALDALIARIAAAPGKGLHALVETAREMCRAGSAGISLLHGDRFVWAAIAGAWAPFVEQELPRSTSPCGVVIEEDVPLLFDRPERFFPEAEPIEPAVQEMLLVPLHLGGRAAGTLWILSHDAHRFDGEDVRILERLALVAIAIEETKAAPADRAHLPGETAQHRVRATLRMIHAILRQADRTAPHDAQALAALGGRVEAYGAGELAGSTDLYLLLSHLAGRYGEHRNPRVHVDGPPVPIASTQAGPLSLAFHELFENAFQHGALSGSDGRVRVTWQVEDAPAPTLRLVWREDRASPGVEAAPGPDGFGFDLLGAGLSALVGAETSLSFGPASFEFTLHLALRQ